MAVNGEPQSQTRASRAYSFGQRQVDRVISPQSREGLYDAINQFATQRPILFVRVPAVELKHSPFELLSLQLLASSR